MAGRVLIFESDAEFAEGLRAALEQLDLTVLVSEDGAAGIGYAKETFPDLVVASAELKGMNGFLICKKFKKSERLRHIPFVILSGEAGAEVFEQHQKLPTRAQAYIKKPVGVQELLERVRVFLPGRDVDDAGVEQDVEIAEWSMEVSEKPTPIGVRFDSERPVGEAFPPAPAAESDEHTSDAPSVARTRSSVPPPLPPSRSSVRPPAPAQHLDRRITTSPDRPSARARPERPYPVDTAEAAEPARRALLSVPLEAGRLFIGCTREGRAVAESIQLGLYPDIEADIGSLNDMGPAGDALDRLTETVAGFGTALLIVTEGDLVRNGHQDSNAPRDNTIFTLGFLRGALGKGRVLLVTIEDLRSHLPSDLAGTQVMAFAIPEDGDLLAATDALCTRIKRAIEAVRE